MKQSIRVTAVKIQRAMIADNRGFTLVEMIIVTAVFIVVLMITGEALKTIFEKGGVTLRSEESNTEGVVGLEMLRRDVQQAGYGLFSDEFSVPTYSEANAAPYSSYNDANAVPRPIVTDNNLAVTGVLAGTDYLVIKGTTLGIKAVTQLWTSVPDTGVPKIWGRDDFTDSNDKMIVVEQKYDNINKRIVRRLVQKSTNNYGVAYSETGAFKDQSNVDSAADYTPSTGKIYYMYGIDNITSTNFTFRAPFNRADYFINRDAATPGSCSPAAGVLFKAVMNQSNGTFDTYPVLDCVADMQIILGWNTTATPETSNEVQAYTSADGITVSGNANGLNLQTILTDSGEVNKRLRLVMVYLLAQDGRRDINFVNTNSAMVVGDPSLGGTLTKTIDLTSGDFRNYRWKLYRVIVRPKNIF
jgi:prepilin-type N-terminal cleavage/methylation domain-containing protein